MNLTCISLVVVLANASTAATFYVATNGNNSNPGTLAQPFRTIARGSQALKPGDTLFLRAGTYPEKMFEGVDGFVFRNGTAAGYTRYAAFPGEEKQVLIRPTTRTLFTVWFSIRNAYIELSGLVIDGADSVWEMKLDAVTSKKNPLTSDGFAHAHHIRIINNEIRGSGFLNIPASCIQLCGDNEFVKNHVHDCGSYGIYAKFDNGLIDGNVIHDTGRWAVHLHSEYSPSPRTNRWVIRNNTFYDNGIRGTFKPQLGLLRSGAVILSEGDETQFYNNLIFGSYGGVRVYRGSKNVLIANNTIVNNTTYGIKVDSTRQKGTRIFNNIVWSNGEAIVDNGTGTILKNNLFTNPQFVSSSARDFRLTAASPAIDRGVSVTEVEKDFVGTARPQGNHPDIGAYEFRAAGRSRTPKSPVQLRIR